MARGRAATGKSSKGSKTAAPESSIVPKASSTQKAVKKTKSAAGTSRTITPPNVDDEESDDEDPGFNDLQLEYLTSRVQGFQGGDKKYRRKVLVEVYEHWAQHFVAEKDIGRSLPDSQKESIRRWLYQRTRNTKYGKYGVRRWNARTVVGQLRRADVEREARRLSGAKPGDETYFKYYQRALNNVFASLTEAQQDDMANVAHEWTNISPPPEVQKRCVFHQHGRDPKLFERVPRQIANLPRVIHSFAETVYRQFGARVVVLAGGVHDVEGKDKLDCDV